MIYDVSGNQAHLNILIKSSIFTDYMILSGIFGGN